MRYQWHAMMHRCYNPKCESYKNYGGRGITVCRRWRDFDLFYADMHPRPSPAHSLDRINNNGPYELSNCRWANHYQQNTNKRNNRLLRLGGNSFTMSQWARRLNLNPSTILARLKRGCTVAQALLPKYAYVYRKRRPNERSNMVTFGGVTMSLTDWARETGFHTHTLSNRLKRGWTVERALTQQVQP